MNNDIKILAIVSLGMDRKKPKYFSTMASFDNPWTTKENEMKLFTYSEANIFENPYRAIRRYTNSYFTELNVFDQFMWWDVRMPHPETPGPIQHFRDKQKLVRTMPGGKVDVWCGPEIGSTGGWYSIKNPDRYAVQSSWWVCSNEFASDFLTNKITGTLISPKQALVSIFFQEVDDEAMYWWWIGDIPLPKHPKRRIAGRARTECKLLNEQISYWVDKVEKTRLPFKIIGVHPLSGSIEFSVDPGSSLFETIHETVSRFGSLIPLKKGEREETYKLVVDHSLDYDLVLETVFQFEYYPSKYNKFQLNESLLGVHRLVGKEFYYVIHDGNSYRYLRSPRQWSVNKEFGKRFSLAEVLELRTRSHSGFQKMFHHPPGAKVIGWAPATCDCPWCTDQ